jgi:MraZ protein
VGFGLNQTDDTFLFLGTHPGTLDENGRLSIPADFRHALEECGENDLVFTPGRKDFIYTFPRKFYNNYLKSIDPFNTLFNKEESLHINIAIHASSVRKSVDSQGRVTLPLALFQRYGMKRDILFIGCGSHFLIWDKAAYETFTQASGITSGEAWERQQQMQDRTKELLDAYLRRNQ